MNSFTKIKCNSTHMIHHRCSTNDCSTDCYASPSSLGCVGTGSYSVSTTCGKLPTIGTNGMMWEEYTDKDCKIRGRSSNLFVLEKTCTPGPGGSVLVFRDSKKMGIIEEFSSTNDCSGTPKQKYKLELNKCSKGIANQYYKMIK